MAWLKSSSDLENHPKTIRLVKFSGWERDSVIGKLHRFWWWVQKYAESGDLTPFSAAEIDAGLGFPDGQNFLEMLVKSGWVDTAPYLRVHDWWDHNGSWLIARYKQTPEKWTDIKRRYKSAGINEQLVEQLPQLFNEQTKDVKDVKDKDIKSSTALRTREAQEKKALKKTDEPEKTEPEKPLREIGQELLQELMNVTSFMQDTVPANVLEVPLDFDVQDANGRTVDSLTRDFHENGMKAAWKIFTDPGWKSHKHARGQKYSVREFLRQFEWIVNAPDYTTLNRKYRQEIWDREAPKMEPVPA